MRNESLFEWLPQGDIPNVRTFSAEDYPMQEEQLTMPTTAEYENQNGTLFVMCNTSGYPAANSGKYALPVWLTIVEGFLERLVCWMTIDSDYFASILTTETKKTTGFAGCYLPVPESIVAAREQFTKKPFRLISKDVFFSLQQLTQIFNFGVTRELKVYNVPTIKIFPPLMKQSKDRMKWVADETSAVFNRLFEKEYKTSEQNYNIQAILTGDAYWVKSPVAGCQNYFGAYDFLSNYITSLYGDSDCQFEGRLDNSQYGTIVDSMGGMILRGNRMDMMSDLPLKTHRRSGRLAAGINYFLTRWMCSPVAVRNRYQTVSSSASSTKPRWTFGHRIAHRICAIDITVSDWNGNSEGNSYVIENTNSTEVGFGDLSTREAASVLQQFGAVENSQNDITVQEAVDFNSIFTGAIREYKVGNPDFAWIGDYIRSEQFGQIPQGEYEGRNGFRIEMSFANLEAILARLEISYINMRRGRISISRDFNLEWFDKDYVGFLYLDDLTFPCKFAFDDGYVGSSGAMYGFAKGGWTENTDFEPTDDEITRCDSLYQADIVFTGADGRRRSYVDAFDILREKLIGELSGILNDANQKGLTPHFTDSATALDWVNRFRFCNDSTLENPYTEELILAELQKAEANAVRTVPENVGFWFLWEGEHVSSLAYVYKYDQLDTTIIEPYDYSPYGKLWFLTQKSLTIPFHWDSAKYSSVFARTNYLCVMPVIDWQWRAIIPE